MRYDSPLRYPGGKARLTGFLADIVELNGLTGCSYFEPYAGGAGAALGLLKRGVVSEVHLNDADRRIHAFWHAVLHSGHRFADRIRSVPLNMEEWHRQRSICDRPKRHSRFDVGFAAFYMNRCNRSGVVGGGPIGGFKQSGRWRMDVRFSREELAIRVLELSRKRSQIHLACEDAITFLKRELPRGPERRRVFAYLDPPYIANGQRLYLNAYRPRDHKKVAHYLKAQSQLRWIMSYDDHDLVRALYDGYRMAKLPIRYVLQVKRTASELILVQHELALPEACRSGGQDHLLSPILNQG